MTYYEEFGIRPDASAREVRQAYRNLVRLLHPDRQADEALKRLAECQMGRLNSAYAALADPVRRQQYDATLNQSAASPILPPVPLAPRRFSARRDLVMLLAGLVLALLCWQPAAPPSPSTLAPSNPESIFRTPAATAQKRPVTAHPLPVRVSRELAKVRRELETVRAERDAALTRLAALNALHDPPAPPASDGGTPQGQPPGPLSPDVPALVAPQSAQASDAEGYAGTWVYVRPRFLPSQQSLYPAEYVEAVIVEGNGVLRGRYRARYRVADRPISSEVAFQFEGKASRETANLDWSGAGGAKGELKLRLLSRNSLRLDWIATNLGSQMGLSSGTAILIRRHEPQESQ